MPNLDESIAMFAVYDGHGGIFSSLSVSSMRS